MVAFVTARAQAKPVDAKLATPAKLGSSSAVYPRVLRLAHNKDHSKNGSLLASFTSPAVHTDGEVTVPSPHPGKEEFYSSTDDGSTFTKVGEITSDFFKEGLCCGTIFELPRRVGALEAGAIIWSGSVAQSSLTEPMRMPVFVSHDEGASWTYLSDCAKAAGPRKVVRGLWEPDFAVAKDGALVCYYSDETEAGHSQVLRQTRTYDGLHWQPAVDIVASKEQSDRPGMPVVTVLPDKTYYMSYEICGKANACSVFSRASNDGWSWGDATDMGERITSVAGQWFEHAPTNVWVKQKGSAAGTLYVIGQVLMEKDGTVSKQNGLVIFADATGRGKGPWKVITAPVPVPTAHDNYCPNYSSPLLPSKDGKSLLELASDYDGKICSTYFASDPIAVLERSSAEGTH